MQAPRHIGCNGQLLPDRHVQKAHQSLRTPHYTQILRYPLPYVPSWQVISESQVLLSPGFCPGCLQPLRNRQFPQAASDYVPSHNALMPPSKMPRRHASSMYFRLSVSLRPAKAAAAYLRTVHSCDPGCPHPQQPLARRPDMVQAHRLPLPVWQAYANAIPIYLIPVWSYAYPLPRALRRGSSHTDHARPVQILQRNKKISRLHSVHSPDDSGYTHVAVPSMNYPRHLPRSDLPVRFLSSPRQSSVLPIPIRIAYPRCTQERLSENVL